MIMNANFSAECKPRNSNFLVGPLCKSNSVVGPLSKSNLLRILLSDFSIDFNFAFSQSVNRNIRLRFLDFWTNLFLIDKTFWKI